MTNPYARPVHEAMDHVRKHSGRDLSLDELASVAHFSPHHFHRIFRAETGETVSGFVRRARLERAVQLMRGSPERPLSSISAEVGFATPSDFSRVFRTNYGCTPSSWDRVSVLPPDRARPIDGPGGEPPTPARIVDRPAARLAYIRVRHPWRRDHLARGYDRLSDWLADRGIGPTTGDLIGLSWENAKTTPLDRLTYDLAVTVGPDIGPDGDIGLHRLPAATAVELRCRSLAETARAWDHLYGCWLPASPYEPADGPAVKRFRRRPEVLDATAWDVDCSIALRPRWP